MNPLRYLENRIRGWLPKEPSPIPSNQRTKMVEISEENRRRSIWKISTANAIILGTFLGLHFLIDPFNENVELTVISWIIFGLAVVSIDFWLYRYFNRKTSKQLEKLRQ
jgi:uncharacterized membrane-anchored protein